MVISLKQENDANNNLYVNTPERFSIVIPAYNEEERIKPILNELCEYIRLTGLNWDLIISIDGNDGTESLVREMSAEYPYLKYTKGKARSGKGAAIKRAIELVSGDFIILMDADGALDFKEILQHLYLLESYDVVNFERYLNRNNSIPNIRRVISRGYNFYIRILLGININDTQCGYKVIKTPIAKEVFRKITITDGFFYAPMFFHLKKMNCRVKEITVNYKHNNGSKFSISSMIIGGFVSAFALRLRYSIFWNFIPQKFIKIYFRLFKWV